MTSRSISSLLVDVGLAPAVLGALQRELAERFVLLVSQHWHALRFIKP